MSWCRQRNTPYTLNADCQLQDAIGDSPSSAVHRRRSTAGVGNRSIRKRDRRRCIHHGLVVGPIRHGPFVRRSIANPVQVLQTHALSIPRRTVFDSRLRCRLRRLFRCRVRVRRVLQGRDSLSLHRLALRHKQV